MVVSTLVHEEKYREGKTCDKNRRQHYNIYCYYVGNVLCAKCNMSFPPAVRLTREYCIYCAICTNNILV